MGLSEGTHAWHIHSGTCESPGAIVLALSDAPAGMQATRPGATTDPAVTRTDDDLRDGIASDLNPNDDGMVEETVNIDREHVQALQAHGSNFIVNVHQRGGDNPGPAIACAPIQLTGAGTWGTTPGTTQPGMQPVDTAPATGARTY
jgi:hypothetical protein